jgi:hypothetical protein
VYDKNIFVFIKPAPHRAIAAQPKPPIKPLFKTIDKYEVKVQSGDLGRGREDSSADFRSGDGGSTADANFVVVLFFIFFFFCPVLLLFTF